MKTIKFYKNPDHRWYADIPEYKGDKADLEMVAGADRMCEIYAQGENEITLTLSTTPIEGLCDILKIIKLGAPEELENIYGEDILNHGAVYKVSTIKSINFDFEIWLCPVTVFVFGEYPEKIYIC